MPQIKNALSYISNKDAISSLQTLSMVALVFHHQDSTQSIWLLLLPEWVVRLCLEPKILSILWEELGLFMVILIHL